MTATQATTERPERWDTPFGSDMDRSAVQRLRSIEPFRSMKPEGFPSLIPLEGLLQNDTRLVHFDPGELIIREGDYGNSAFMLLHGQARVAIDSLDAETTGKPLEKKGQFWKAVAQLWRSQQTPEVRHSVTDAAAISEAAIFLQDVPRIIKKSKTVPLGPGEVFGELAALSRTPRSASVFAEDEVIALEIRWQGLRDLMRYTPSLQDHIHQLYRRNSLRVHLRETSLFTGLSSEQLEAVARMTTFETHGSFDWHADLEPEGDTLYERITREPLVAEEGVAPDGLLLVRSGFARVSHRRGDGHQTVSYLGKGQSFGMPEIAALAIDGNPAPLRYSLRAVGYVDLLRIPTKTVLAEILPTLPTEQLQQLATLGKQVPQLQELALDSPAAKHTPDTTQELPSSTLDFLVDRRLNNGVQAMVINLNRCTRCDDCVRACASTHDGNPRFIRQGPIQEHFQFANACMQCVDPVCMIGCPTGAIHRDAQTGIVRINDDTCVGCSTCADSCPYNNIRMVEIRDPSGIPLVDQDTGQPIAKATKCDLCIDQSSGPACQNACPHDALVRIDIAEITPLAEWMQS